MAEYVEIEQARHMSGLRLVLLQGRPSPWGEALKGVFQVKKVPFVRVRKSVGTGDEALQQWTGQTSVPVAVWNDERPLSHWDEQLFLAERLASNPPLIPDSVEDRVQMFGYSNELCGENGFGWSRRLMLLNAGLSDPNVDQGTRAAYTHMGKKYGYSSAAAQAAAARTASIVQSLAAQLERQKARDSRYFVGDRLSALDIYWAAFAVLIKPLPEELCPLPAALRTFFTNTDPRIQSAMTPRLMEHRDFVYREYLELPVQL